MCIIQIYKKNVYRSLSLPVSIAPLITFRILFGLLALYGGVWSFLKNDLEERFLAPTFFFKYAGFDWVIPPNEVGLYLLYTGWIISAIGIISGALYRLSIATFFIIFSYLQLIDATNYINHYYAISIFAFLLIFLPANANCSVDAHFRPNIRQQKIPFGYIFVFQLQLAIIYIFAAISKINSDWLLAAIPLKIWLLQSQDFPILGPLFKYHSIHIAMSWAGFLFDLSIVFLLWNSKTRKVGYLMVLFFHIVTGMLLEIGLFPWLMICSTTIFFAPQTHERWLKKIGFYTPNQVLYTPSNLVTKLFMLHIILQLFLPLRRHILYKGNYLWTEEGYRFSWSVMLVEKEGMATFYIKDPNSSRQWEVNNLDFLTPFQEKRMIVRPYHIIQYAHHLAKIYSRRYAIDKPIVQGTIHVTLNGRVSQLLIDPNINLAAESIHNSSYDWIRPFNPK